MTTMTLIKQFAATRRLTVRLDEDRTEIVRGKLGHIYDQGNGRTLGVALQMPTIRHWSYCRERLLKAGAILKQNGDSEGSFEFEPSNDVQSKAAIREAKAKVRRTMSPAQSAVLEKARSRSGFKSLKATAQTHPEPCFSDDLPSGGIRTGPDAVQREKGP